MIFLYIFIILTNLILVLCCKRSKIIEYISVFFVLLLACCNSSNGDYLSYARRYYAGDMSSFESGFRYIGELFNNFGWHYNVFMGLLFFLAFLIVLCVIKKLNKSTHLFFALWLVIILFYDIDQIRNFIVSSLLLLGFYCLIRGRKILYIVTLLVAVLFHKIALIYIPLVLINPRFINKNWKLILFFSMLVCGVVFINGNTIPFLNEIIYFVTKDEGKLFYGSQRIHLGFALPFMLHILNTLVVIFSIKILKKNQCKLTTLQKNLICWTKAVMILGYLIFPLIMIDLTFDRIIRNFTYLVFITAGIAMSSFRYSVDEVKNKNIIQLLMIVFLIVYSVSWNVLMVIRYGTHPTEMNLILNNNFVMNGDVFLRWNLIFCIGVLAIIIEKIASKNYIKKKSYIIQDRIYPVRARFAKH